MRLRLRRTPLREAGRKVHFLENEEQRTECKLQRGFLDHLRMRMQIQVEVQAPLLPEGLSRHKAHVDEIPKQNVVEDSHTCVGCSVWSQGLWSQD